MADIYTAPSGFYSSTPTLAPVAAPIVGGTLGGTVRPASGGFTANPSGANLSGTAESSSSATTEQGATQQQQLQQTNESRTGTETMTGTQNVTGTTDSVQNQRGSLDFMDPATRNAYMQFLTTLSQGGNAGVNEATTARTNILNSMLSQLGDLDPTRAGELASGNVAGLTRQLMEQVLPGIVGNQEQAGGSGSALTSLLAQDAAVRTAEAQQRAQLEAMLGIGQQFTGLSGVAGDFANTQDPATAAMMQVLGIGKGSAEQRDLTTTGRDTTAQQTTTDQRSTSTDLLNSLIQSDSNLQTAGTTSSTGSATGAASGDSMTEKLAALQSMLGPFQTVGNSLNDPGVRELMTMLGI